MNPISTMTPVGVLAADSSLLAPVLPQADTQLAEKNASESRKELVRQLTGQIVDARDFWQPVFKQMRENIDFAGGDQWQDKEEEGSDKYKVNFVQRELNQEVAAVYAQNPTFTCQRKPRREYKVWDGSKEQLEQATQQLATAYAQFGATQPPPLKAKAIVEDHAAGLERKKLLDNIADTLELAFAHQIGTQKPDFECQMKSAILREKTTGVAFVTAKYERELHQVPTTSANNTSFISKLMTLRGEAEQLKGESGDSAKIERLKIMVTSINQEMQKGAAEGIKNEGIVFDFRPSTSVIVDPKCRCLLHFVGADWVVEEYMLTPEQISAQWGKDIRGSGAVAYNNGEEPPKQVSLKTKAGGAQNATDIKDSEWGENSQACVWIMYHKRDNMAYVICHGYEDFLEEPQAPWPSLSSFWPIAALKLTRIEIEENKPAAGVTIYGQSAVELMRPMQMEMNRSQEALREHRKANRPGWVCPKNTFSEGDKKNMSGRSAHDCIPLDNVPPGGDVSKVLAPIPTIELDPQLYRTDGTMQHVTLVVGSQQSNMGGQGRDEKATGQAIAEQSRIQNVSSETDSLDKFLTQLARISGEMILTEMQDSTLVQIVGPGFASFGQISRQELKDCLYLEVEAASSGRPNKAIELENLSKMLPQLLPLAQARGLPLDPLVKYAAKVMELDKHFDLDEWLASAPPVPIQQVPPGQPVPAQTHVQSGQGMPAAPAPTMQRMAPQPH